MTELQKALRHLAEGGCYRRGSAAFRRAEAQLAKARDPLEAAHRICIAWEREKAQQITTEIWDRCASDAHAAARLLARTLMHSLGGDLDPTHIGILRDLKSATRGEFVRRGAEAFRMQSYDPDAREWRAPRVTGDLLKSLDKFPRNEGVRYSPTLPPEFAKKDPMKSMGSRGVLQDGAETGVIDEEDGDRDE